LEGVRRFLVERLAVRDRDGVAREPEPAGKSRAHIGLARKERSGSLRALHEKAHLRHVWNFEPERQIELPEGKLRDGGLVLVRFTSVDERRFRLLDAHGRAAHRVAVELEDDLCPLPIVRDLETTTPEDESILIEDVAALSEIVGRVLVGLVLG